jgi:hypothetical protein
VWTVFLRYLRWGRQLRLLRILRGAHDDHPSLGLAVLRACASADHPAVWPTVARGLHALARP